MAFREFMSFLLNRKRYWLLPLLIFVGVLAAIMYLAHRREALAPFVYSLREAPIASAPLKG